MSGVISDNTVRSSGQVAPLTSATTDANDPARDTNPTDGLGTKWINTTSGQIFICTDATSDANEWTGQTGTSIQPRIIFAGGNSDDASEHQPGVKINELSFRNPSTLGDFVDFGDLVATNQYFAGTSNGVNDRGIFGGGYSPNATDTIQYFTCSTAGNCIDFGNLTEARGVLGACSNGTTDRAVFAGGGLASNPPQYDITTDRIDYITISSPGNATDQGNLVRARDYCAALSNGTNDRGINATGRTFSPEVMRREIDYWTISSTGNSADFGDLTDIRMAPATASSDTNERGLFMAGSYGADYGNEIDYITISTTGNATDFGDMAGADPAGYPVANGVRGHPGGSSNGTGERGFCMGGYTNISSVQSWYKQIEYVTISTPGNSQAFGNLNNMIYGMANCSNTFG